MPPNHTNNIAGITGMRGYAALWVMFFHIATWAHITTKKEIFFGINFSFLWRGWVGVYILFVLSGFLLFLPFAEQLIDGRNVVDIKQYLIRRIMRIFPAYYAQMAILALLVITGIYSLSGTYDVWLAHIFMIHNIHYLWSNAINGPWWTLPAEFDFYLLLPLFFVAMKKYGFVPVITAMVLVDLAYKILILHVYPHRSGDCQVWLLGQVVGKLDLFACGMCLAYLYKKYPLFFKQHTFSEHHHVGVVTVALVAMLLLVQQSNIYWTGHWSLYLWDAAVGLCISIMLVSIMMGGKLNAILFSNPLILYLGEISYGIYLWHVVFIILLLTHKTTTDYLDHYVGYIKFYVMARIVVPATMLSAALSYHWIEKPCLRFSHQWAKIERISVIIRANRKA